MRVTHTKKGKHKQKSLITQKSCTVTVFYIKEKNLSFFAFLSLKIRG